MKVKIKKNWVWLVLIGAVIVLFMVSQRPVVSSVLAVSRIYIDEQNGYEKNGEWFDSYWVVLSTTQTYGEHIFYQFDKDETAKYGEDEIDGKKLVPKAKITVTVEVSQPYLRRSLINRPYTLHPEVYGCHKFLGGNEAWEESYEWDAKQQKWVKVYHTVEQQSIIVKETTGVWEIVIPIKLSVVKEDDKGNIIHLVDENGNSDIQLNITGPEALLPIHLHNPKDTDETMTFKLEGMLSTGQYPSIPDLMIFPNNMIFEKDANVLNLIKFSTSPDPQSYIMYWYGDDWTVHPSGYMIVLDTDGAGVFSETYGLDQYIYPSPMPIMADLPRKNWGTVKSLITWVREHAREIETDEIDVWGEGYEILDSEIRVYAPYNSWLWMFTLKISTQLADTYVWKPAGGAKGTFMSCKWSGDGKKIEISTTAKIRFEIRNDGPKGNVYVVPDVTPKDAPLKISSWGALMDYSESKIGYLTVTNLGPKEKTEGSITLQLKNDNNEVTDTYTLNFVLLPIEGNTLLNVLILEEGSEKKVSGLPVSISYGSESDLSYTDEGWVNFDLGAYQGEVLIQTEETTFYYASEKTVTVETGSNDVTIYVKRKSITPITSGDEFWWGLTLGLLGVTTVVCVIVLVWMWRRRKKQVEV